MIPAWEEGWRFLLLFPRVSKQRMRMKKELQHLLKKRFNLRLAIAIPLIFTFFVFSLALFNFLLVEGVIKNSRIINLVNSTRYAKLLNSFYFYQVFILVYAGIIGLILGYALVFPLKRITNLFHRISQGDYTASIDLGGDKETEELASAFNRMLSSFNEYILESISSGIITIDRQNRIININSSAAAILGVEASELTLKDISYLFPRCNENGPFYEVMREALLFSRVVSSLEIEVLTRNNLKVNLGISVSLLRDRGDTLLGVVLSFRDLTQLKKELHKRELTQRLSSLGRLALGIVHEIRNPLLSIQGLVKLLQTEDLSPQKHKEYLAIISQELGRLDDLSSELLALAPRHKNIEPQEININILLDDSLRLAEFRKPENIEIMKNYRSDLPSLKGDPSLLKQAFLNIIINSFDAMPQGGVLSLTTDYGQEKVVVEFKDTGTGVKAENKEKVIEPFFTTKEGGIGLGLSVVSNIVNLHKGSLEIKDNVPQGTIVKIILPLRNG